MNITQEEFEALSAIRNYQDKIYQKLREIKSKIYQKEGYFFVNHIYTDDQLLRDSAFNTIKGIMENLEDSVYNWGNRNNGYSEFFYNEYSRIRERIQNELNNLIDEISNRPPMGWERIKKGFVSTIRFLIKKLPIIIFNAFGLHVQGFEAPKQIES